MVHVHGTLHRLCASLRGHGHHGADCDLSRPLHSEVWTDRWSKWVWLDVTGKAIPGACVVSYVTRGGAPIGAGGASRLALRPPRGPAGDGAPR